MKDASFSQGSSRTQSIVFGDLDEDGDLDVVVGSTEGINTVHFFQHCDRGARLGSSQACVSIPAYAHRAAHTDQAFECPADMIGSTGQTECQPCPHGLVRPLGVVECGAPALSASSHLLAWSLLCVLLGVLAAIVTGCCKRDLSAYKRLNEHGHDSIPVAHSNSDSKRSDDSISNGGMWKLDTLRLVRKLGEGGFSIVWEGTLQGTPVAVKVSKPHCSGKGDQVVKVVNQEIKRLSALRHPHVVSYFSAGTFKAPANSSQAGKPTECWTGIVLELMKGGTVGQYLALDGPKAGPKARSGAPALRMSLAERLTLARQTASGLAYIHDAGIIHRDVKNSNVLLTESHGMLIAKLSDVSGYAIA